MEPTIKRIRLSTPYVVHPQTGQIYGRYKVMVKWSDGTKKTFDSEEHARAYLEGRPFEQGRLQAEVPLGFVDALLKNMPEPEPDEHAPPAEPDIFDVVLTGFTGSKVAVIKALRTLTGQGLKECKEFVDNLPAIIQKEASKDSAETMKQELEALGAAVEFK